MDPPRLYSHRPSSPTSSITTRSSFESRHKSPLSISSSAEYESSRTSEDSSFSNSNGKHDLLASRSPIPPTPAPAGKRMVTEPIVPMFSRYGAGGEGRQQTQQTTLVIPPRLSKGPPSPTSPRRRTYAPRVPGEGFKKLPEEILLVVLGELKKLHLNTGSLSCPTCWMRDLMNLGLSCKKWWMASRIALYEDIQLTGCDSVLHTKKKYKMKYGTRLTLLRRTLRARPDYAEYTKSLKVPAMPDAAKSKKEQDEYLDLVASLIMACPNLERLPGFYPTYNHEFSRFVNALATRTKLVERVWVINPSPFQRQHRFKLSDNSQDILPTLAPGPLMPEQCIDLITYHRNWNNLQTLVVHCNPGGTIDSPLFTDIFWSLPTLENLHISGFPAAAFNDSTLLALPPLKSLRLENLPGITDEGLSTYAAPRRADALTSLTLISIPLVSLQVLSRLFSHLKSLTHFTISQPYPPILPDAGEIFLHPYLANRNLEYLHWEFANADDNQATEIMAKSIQFRGFPSLRTIRAPTDHEGSLQRLCRPRERIELPADRYRNMALSRRPSPQRSQTTPVMPSPTRSTFSLGHGPNSSISSNYVKSPTRSTFSLNLDRSSRTSDDSTYGNKPVSLATARRMAQQRIDVASTQPQFHIIVWDEFGVFVERFAVGGFIGTIQSKISYTLKPDVDGSDEAIFGVEGLLDGGDEVTPKDGCTGNWNLMAGVYEKGKTGGEKKGKDKWWHTERGRWREIPLEKLF
ncbi:hypothetical protein L207DRAFT_575503 [Hyaloscypha variabilis F]|uniref:F-box domain-containing protein n=1 Tax=Hyaloscypha variabilis (strain UAMH 11265 / GT02V1 / F) TaxID=1149755 RepID=A0A2J6SDL1_HYAVF|nr:hypothetical protein L207DRAFT_575503 [Hyaloscypha variabilis F]